MNITGIDGTIAEVNSSNQMETSGVSVSAMHEASLKGDAYSWTAITSDINTGDTALLVQNTSKTRKLVIESIYAYADVPSLLKIHVPIPATWSGGAVVVGVNLNREKSAVLAEAISRSDEEASTFTAANTILTIATNELTGDQFGVYVERLHGGGVVLGYHDAIAIDVIGETAAYETTITGYYID